MKIKGKAQATRQIAKLFPACNLFWFPPTDNGFRGGEAICTHCPREFHVYVFSDGSVGAYGWERGGRGDLTLEQYAALPV
jgi:hypothetical protein